MEGLTITVTVKHGSESKQFVLEDKTPKKAKKGKYMHFQPADECTLLAPFGKVYVDLAEAKKLKSK